MTVFPPEIYSEILAFAFCTNGPCTPLSEPTPRRDALHLPLVSVLFYKLCQAPLFAFITLTKPSAWITLFDSKRGLLVAGKRAEARRRAVRELSLDLAALPAPTVDWGVFQQAPPSDFSRDTHALYAGEVEALVDRAVVVPPLIFRPLPNAVRLVMHCPARQLQPHILAGNPLPLTRCSGASLGSHETKLHARALSPLYRLFRTVQGSVRSVDAAWNDHLVFLPGEAATQVRHLIETSFGRSFGDSSKPSLSLRLLPSSHPRTNQAVDLAAVLSKKLAHGLFAPSLGDRLVEVSQTFASPNYQDLWLSFARSSLVDTIRWYAKTRPDSIKSSWAWRDAGGTRHWVLEST